MSDQESPGNQGGESPFEPQLPPGMSEAQIVGGPTPQQGRNAVPLTPPPGGSFTFWAHGDGGTMTPGLGLPPSLYLVYQADQEEGLLAWADSLASYVKGIIYVQRRIRARSIQKAAERASSQPQQLSPHRPRRIPPNATQAGAPQPQAFAPPAAAPQFQPPQPPQAQPPQAHGPQPFPHVPAAAPRFAPPGAPGAHPVARPHRPHPASAVPQSQMDQEAEVARARVRSKEQLAQTLQAAERLAAVPQGLAYLERIVEEARARQAAVHPPGSPSIAVAAAAGQPLPPPQPAPVPQAPPAPPPEQASPPPTPGAMAGYVPPTAHATPVEVAQTYVADTAPEAHVSHAPNGTPPQPQS